MQAALFYAECLSPLFQGMIQEKLISHASGDFSKSFILGFYLYHIVQDKDSQKGNVWPEG